MIPTRTCVMACAGALAAAAAFAQTPEEVRRNAQIRLGALYATPRLAVKEFGVDTNVFNNADEKRDFTFTLAPAAGVWIPFGRRGLLSTDVSTEVVYYQAYASERSINPAVRTRGDLFLGRVTPYLEGGYLRTRQRPDEEIDARSLRQDAYGRAGIGIRVFSRIAVELDSGYRRLSFDEEATFNNVRLQETLNRTTRTTGASARYTLTPLTTLMVRVEAERNRFEFSPLRDSASWKVVPGVEFKPVALIAGTAHVGVKQFTPADAAMAPFNGLVTRTSLSYTLKGATRFTVTAGRDLTYSYERLEPYYVVTTYGLTIRRHLSGPVDVTATIQRDRYTYRDLRLPGATASDAHRVDAVQAWGGSVGYRVGRSMRAGIGVSRRARTSSSQRFRDYTGLRLVTTLDFDF